MMKRAIPFAMAAALAAAGAGAQPPVTQTRAPGQAARAASPADTQFMRDAAADGLAEVELGKMAQDKASRQDIRDFAKMMVADHSRANAELKALAARKDVRLPDDVKLEHKSEKERLEQLAGPAFDEAYASHMVKDHQKAVTLFGQQARTGLDPATKEWAARTLPTLEQHLAKAREIAGKKASEGGDHKH